MYGCSCGLRLSLPVFAVFSCPTFFVSPQRIKKLHSTCHPVWYAKRYCRAHTRCISVCRTVYTQLLLLSLLFLMQLTEQRGSRFSLSLDGGCHTPHSSCRRRGLFSISGRIKTESHIYHLQSRNDCHRCRSLPACQPLIGPTT